MESKGQNKVGAFLIVNNAVQPIVIPLLYKTEKEERSFMHC